MRRSLEGYRIRHTRFGDGRGAFRRAGLAAVQGLAAAERPLIVCLAVAAVSFAALAEAKGQPGAVALGIGAGIALGVLAAFWAVLLWPYYRVREFRIFTDATAIGR